MEHIKKNIQPCLHKSGGGEGVFSLVGKYLDKLFIKTYKHENTSNAKELASHLNEICAKM